MRLVQGVDGIYGRGRLEIFNQAKNEWGTVNGNLGRFDFAAANVACRAMGYNCVMDWGLAKDWGLELDEEEAKEMAIGYWGHSCDGDEPGLQYCCNAPRRWIGDRFRTMSSFSRKSIITFIVIVLRRSLSTIMRYSWYRHRSKIALYYRLFIWFLSFVFLW